MGGRAEEGDSRILGVCLSLRRKEKGTKESEVPRK